MKKQSNPNNPKGQKSNKSGKGPRRFGLLNSISMGLVVLFLITSLYSIIAEQNSGIVDINLSELVHDVGMGKVMAITVRGDDIIAEYADKVLKKTKKEH